MLPEKYLERMKQMLGNEYPLFLKSYEEKEYHALRLNTLKVNKDVFCTQLPFDLKPVEWSTAGFYYGENDRPGRHPYHDAGLYYIQEASAMAPVEYLEAQPGERILDLCAAPGGKTTQIAAAMRQKGILVCNEIHPQRAKILSENVERLGIRNAIVTNETPQRLAETFEMYFDRILVDAPCSGEGMFRKNEEATQEWSEDNVLFCAGRQDEILECAERMLKPGGRLVYSTCTFAPMENEGTISRFLERYPDFEVVEVKKYPQMAAGEQRFLEQFCEGETDFCQSLEHTIRLWPHKLSGEGHYVAVLQKKGELQENGSTRKKQKLQKGISEKECKEYTEFAKQYLRNLNYSGIYVKFGEQLFLAPEETPLLEGMKVLRPGLHLGTCKKNRFEPSHALALSLEPGQAANTLDFPAESPQIQEYLKGYTVTAEGDKGWYLITTDGHGIGWGKLSGSVMKNHYPKGLRKV